MPAENLKTNISTVLLPMQNFQYLKYTKGVLNAIYLIQSSIYLTQAIGIRASFRPWISLPHTLSEGGNSIRWRGIRACAVAVRRGLVPCIRWDDVETRESKTYTIQSVQSQSTYIVVCHGVNSLRPRPDGRHFPDDIFKCIFLNENL